MVTVKKSALESESNVSIGEQMNSTKTQRDRNLAVKAELIKEGTHPKSKHAPNMNNRERNLALKAELKGEKPDPKKVEAAKAEREKIVKEDKVVKK